MKTSNAAVVVVDDDFQMKKVLKVRHKLPNLKAVVQISETSEFKNEDGIWKWRQLEEINTDDVNDEYEKRQREVTANECCAVLYTSGTVGNPKGALISHDNFTWTVAPLAKRLGISADSREILMSYLPLSHMAGQVVDIFMSIAVAATVFIAEKNAMKASFLETLVEVRPIIFIGNLKFFSTYCNFYFQPSGVPRIYEKIQSRTYQLETRSGRFLNLIGTFAKNLSLNFHLQRALDCKQSQFFFNLAKFIYLNDLKYKLGLDRCRNLITAAAPMSIELKHFFLSLDLPLKSKSGMTEVTVLAAADLDVTSLETVGRSFDGVETKIIHPNSSGHGEICVRGRNVFMGYLNEETQTRETIDDDRWMHTGDLGTIDENGLIFITGRLKEIIITSGGENVPPIRIEDHIKAECEAISNVFLVGDKRRFLNVLITLKTEVDAHGFPTDELASSTLKFLKSMDLYYTKLDEIFAAGPDRRVLQVIQDAIDQTNQKAISNAQKVQKFVVLPRDFSHATGELGPTMKLKRNEVLKKYSKIIDKFYEEQTVDKL